MVTMVTTRQSRCTVQGTHHYLINGINITFNHFTARHDYGRLLYVVLVNKNTVIGNEMSV